ncbi:MAG TPA: ABC transporter ATP-binding protein [Egicoccus sp.]|nr:ABC transporter ATP-binding protein [Egicoccus sp.]HSK23389.1 ABC transporter ATP-binding protein [Egicoccus sp.]
MTTLEAPLPSADPATGSMISVRGLRKHYPIKEGVLQRITGHVKAVDGVDFDIRRGEIVGMVGESGCGKTTLGRCISGLTDPTAGGVYFGLPAAEQAELDRLLGVDESERTSEQSARLDALGQRYRVDRMSSDTYRHYRRNCQVVFQDSFSSLNPRHLVKDIVGRPLRVHKEAAGAELTERTVELLERVGLGRQHLYRYPHQFSGGQRQRISIARALALDPEFVVLDEPTSALDVSVQAQILNLLHDLQADRGLTYLFISHDLNVVRHMSDRIVVMYLGKVVEEGPAEQVFSSPRHPYTEALLAANPTLEDTDDTERIVLEGTVPDPARPPQGCRFHTRCPVVTARCGWEVDDIVRQLEDHPGVLGELDAVTRHSPFAADLQFDDGGAAARLVATLREHAPLAMQEAIEELRNEGPRVKVRFREVDPMRLLPVEPDHVSACLLHTDQ